MMAAVSYFAVMNMIVKLLVRIPIHEIVIFRAAIIFILSYSMMKQKRINPWGNDKVTLFWRGIFGTVSLIMFFYTLHAMPLASAVTIQYLAPVFTILFASLIMKEHSTVKQLTYFMLAFLGVTLIKGFDPRVSIFDLSIGIGAAVFVAIAYNLVRKLKETDHPLVVIFYFAMITLFLVLPYSITHWVIPRADEWFMLITIGTLTHLAQIHLTSALQLERATNVSQFTYIGTIYAIAFGLIFFNESIPPMALLGIFLIVLGVMLGTKNSLKA